MPRFKFLHYPFPDPFGSLGLVPAHFRGFQFSRTLDASPQERVDNILLSVLFARDENKTQFDSFMTPDLAECLGVSEGMTTSVGVTNQDDSLHPVDLVVHEIGETLKLPNGSKHKVGSNFFFAGSQFFDCFSIEPDDHIQARNPSKCEKDWLAWLKGENV